MRVRLLTALAVAALAVPALSACTTKVGAAAIVDGQRISESEVAHYLTPAAEQVPTQNAAGSATTISPRAYVLDTLINTNLAAKILGNTPAGMPSNNQIVAAKQQSVAGSTVAAFVATFVRHGYTAGFADVLLRERALVVILQSRAQGGVDVTGIIKKLRFPVAVSARYGSWNAAGLALDTTPTAGVPGFVTLDPATSTPSPVPTATPTG